MDFIIQRPDLILDGVIEHLYITILAVLGATVLGVLLGILITRLRSLYDPILTVAGVIYTIPSLAMFVLLIPILGIGFESAVIALVLYSLLIIIRNTAVGLDSVDQTILEAARGMGMTPLGILVKVELPLALPIIFAGIRIATVSAISLATIASFIGAGGIGDLLFQGITSQRNDKIVAGAIVASVMALGAEVLLRQIEHGASPGASTDFKTLGEHIAGFLESLREKPDTIVLAGAVLALLGYFGTVWVSPYAGDLAQNSTALQELETAGYSLQMTGFRLSQIGVDVPIRQSLQIFPWIAGLAGILAFMNVLRNPRSRASAEVLLICGLLLIFPLLHFYFETQRAVGDLGTSSDLFRAVRQEISALSSARVSPRLDSLPVHDGYWLSVFGTVLILAGSYLKSLWFRRLAQRESHISASERSTA